MRSEMTILNEEERNKIFELYDKPLDVDYDKILYFYGIKKDGESIPYWRYALLYMETCNRIETLEKEAKGLLLKEKEIPPSLAHEIFRYWMLSDSLIFAGQFYYFLKPERNVYEDGWYFWFKQDGERRNKEYEGQTSGDF